MLLVLLDNSVNFSYSYKLQESGRWDYTQLRKDYHKDYWIDSLNIFDFQRFSLFIVCFICLFIQIYIQIYRENYLSYEQNMNRKAKANWRQHY